jgi:hypothetical protein
VLVVVVVVVVVVAEFEIINAWSKQGWKSVESLDKVAQEVKDSMKKGQ